MRDINLLQIKIFRFVKHWADNKKTPIPQSEIIKAMKKKGVKTETARYAIYSLVDKGYIRTAYMQQTSKTYYVQIRNL